MKRAVSPWAPGVLEPPKKVHRLRVVEVAPPPGQRQTVAEMCKAVGLKLVDGRVVS